MMHDGQIFCEPWKGFAVVSGQFAPNLWTIRPQPQDNSPHRQFALYIYCTNLASLNSLNIAN